MERQHPRAFALLAIALFTAAEAANPAAAEHIFARIDRMVEQATYHGTEPVSGADCAIETLAENIDWLEHHVDTYGSIVAKSPDIWGEARLTKFRDEYERIMFRELAEFKVKINASIAQSDSAFLAQALALSSAAGADTQLPLSNTIAAAQVPQQVTAGSVTAVLADAGAAPFRTADDKLTFSQFDTDLGGKIALEPVIELDQLSRYLNHLHELRRINEGDDTSDSPGYSLNLVRIPVSILPGKLTRTGFGAEVTVTCTPVITDDLMPTTFHNLAINDMVDLLGLPLVRTTESRLYGKLAATDALPIFEQQVTAIEGALESASGEQEIANAFGKLMENAYLRSSILAVLSNAELAFQESQGADGTDFAVAASSANTTTLVIGPTAGSTSPAIQKLYNAVEQSINAKLERPSDSSSEAGSAQRAADVQERTQTFQMFVLPGTAEPTLNMHNSANQLLNDVKNFDSLSPDRQDQVRFDLVLAFFRNLKNAFQNGKPLDAARVLTAITDEKVVEALYASVDELVRDLETRKREESLIAVPTGRARRALNPLSPTSVVNVVGFDSLVTISRAFEPAYYGRYIRWNGGRGCDSIVTCPKAGTDLRVDLLDAQRFLQAELEAAYQLLSQPEHVRLYAEFAASCSGLAKQIRAGHLDHACQGLPSVEEYRHRFFLRLHEHCVPCADGAPVVPAAPGPIGPYELPCPTGQSQPCEMCFAGEPPMPSTEARNTVEALAWALVVESALLNERLNLDVRKVAKSKQHPELDTTRDYLFFLPETVATPCPGLEDLQTEFQQATDIFKRYVEVRWPIHVFAVDPREQDQNVADVSARKRELQFALALGFVTGQIGVNSLTQYSRELQTQIETIALNRTVIGFGHGDDTFGWRFQPRVQGLYVPNNCGAVREILCGVSRDYDLRHRQLEPGQRDCTAIVLMPSFVPYADFDIRTNWYKLTNPKNAAITMKETMRLSRAITAMRNSQAQCSECAMLYRENEVQRLLNRVDQLDRELPLQTQRVLVPYENTLGGFEMFNTGVTDLSPELIGWYGAPGVVISRNGCNQFRCGCAQKCTANGHLAQIVKDITVGTDPNECVADVVADPLPICEGEGTTLFLVGDNFSVHDTKVIAGGVCIPHVQLVSRQIMRVTIPSCVQTVTLCENGCLNEYVAVYVATPYGVTNHLHVPIHCVDFESKPPAPCTTPPEEACVAKPASDPASLDGPSLAPPIVTAQRNLIRLPPTGNPPRPTRDERSLLQPTPRRPVNGANEPGAFRGTQQHEHFPVHFTAYYADVTEANLLRLAQNEEPSSSNGTPTGENAEASDNETNGTPTPSVDDLVEQLKVLREQIEGQRTMFEAALARDDFAAALAGQSVVNVNVIHPPGLCTRLWEESHFPCGHQAFVRTRECWRNVRDQLPCN